MYIATCHPITTHIKLLKNLWMTYIPIQISGNAIYACSYCMVPKVIQSTFPVSGACQTSTSAQVVFKNGSGGSYLKVAT